IAAAEPTSAWQPPAAPEIDALFATTKPNAPDVSKKFSISFREGSRRGFKPNNTPGTTPADPAVGVAQILPIAAFTSFVATALLTASNNVLPANDLPVFKYSLINTASPPVNPVVEVTPSKPSSSAFSIVCKFLSILAYISASDKPVTSISCSSIIS